MSVSGHMFVVASWVANVVWRRRDDEHDLGLSVDTDILMGVRRRGTNTEHEYPLRTANHIKRIASRMLSRLATATAPPTTPPRPLRALPILARPDLRPLYLLPTTDSPHIH